MIKIYPKLLEKDKIDVETLLKQEGIRFEENVEKTFGKYENAKLIATASIYKNIIKCVAIDPSYKGGAIFNEMMTTLLSELNQNSYDAAFVYTKPIYETSFASIGFKEIERVGNELIFMEKSRYGFKSYLNKLRQRKVDGDVIGSIVLNANPFTLGHQYLVDYGSKHSTYLHIFVVSEDASYFSAKDRYEMVKLGVKNYDNIIIHTTDSYLVSAATFPSYFIDEEKSVTKIHASLDARIFKYHIGKALEIDKRFVGTEPNDEATRIYNESMREIFEENPNPNVPELVEIPRKKFAGEVISASRVRKLLDEGKIDKIKDLVPQTTFDYIKKHKL